MALDPQRLVLCWPNYIDGATLSGGGYVPTLPLDHAQDRRFAVIAKSASLDPADTQFTITLPRRRPVSVLAIPAHNLSPFAEIRVRVYRDAARADEQWDSGWRDVWPVVYGLEDVVWGDDNFWNRRLDADARDSYTPLLTMLFDDTYISTAVTVELNDPENASGAVIFGRVFLADAWQPRFNMSLGVRYGYDSGTEISTAGDAARTEYADRVTPKRTVQFDLGHLDEAEAFLRLHRLQRTEDIVGEVLFMHSITPSPANFARAMIGRQQSLDPLAQPYQLGHSNSISLLEIL